MSSEPDSVVEGLPGPLPQGERLLWQGAPDWRHLAKNAFHVRLVALYFAILLGWYVISSIQAGTVAGALAAGTLRLGGLALVPVALVVGYSWLVSRSTRYTITSRRVVIRCGVAMPITINIPFRKVDSADLKLGTDGRGDICLTLSRSEHLAYVVLWPHARPWRLARTEPMLRQIPEAERVAQVLGRALAGGASLAVGQTAPDPRRNAATRNGPAAVTA